MDKAAVMAALEALPRDEQYEVIDAIWERLRNIGPDDLTPEVIAELERRLDAADANPGPGCSWEEVVAHCRRPRESNSADCTILYRPGERPA